jgi:nucleotide-binding universal stress UspA family protein
MNIACIPLGSTAATPAAQALAFKRVLVPTDFSLAGDRAVAQAFRAAKSGGEVCLLHVVRPTTGFRSNGKRSRRRQKSILAELQRLIPIMARERGVQNRLEVVEHEHPSVAICQAAERFGADLICLGKPKESGLRTKVFGSTARSVMRRSSRPVLVISS